jgi:hypothetical protein
LIIGEVITGFDLCESAGFVVRACDDRNWIFPVYSRVSMSDAFHAKSYRSLLTSLELSNQPAFKRLHAGSSAFFSLGWQALPSAVSWRGC